MGSTVPASMLRGELCDQPQQACVGFQLGASQQVDLVEEVALGEVGWCGGHG